jgi:uncharacterized UBP type Zn finger protein
MFGLKNFRGSCWVNSCLQSLFRIPEVQERYNSQTFDKDNPIDECLCKIWNSKGEEGLKEFFDSVRTTFMPAGRGVGDTHELLTYLCDKLPYLDKLCRFKMADSITCNSCKHQELKEDSVLEFSLDTSTKCIPLTNCITNTVTPITISEWKCDKCNQLGCVKQQLIGSFPKVMMFHKVSTQGSVEYSSILVLNSKQYALISVSCYNGSHWWAYGRNMPPGSSWYTIDDTRLQEHGPKQFPVSSTMRLLIYYRLEN